MGMVMSRQDLLELYQLLRMYGYTYHPTEKLSVEEWLERIGNEYAHVTRGLDVRKESNPRGAGRKKKYGKKENEVIAALRKEGKSLREIARETGCSPGHVQDVLRKE